MTFKVRITGVSSLNRKLKQLGIDVDHYSNQVVNKGAVIVHAKAVKRIMKSGKGRIYTKIFRTIGGRAVPVADRAGNNLSPSHRASAPGDAPANDTGGLVAGIQIGFSTGDKQASVKSTAKQSAYLEFGTSKMAARPYMRPSARESEPEIQKVAIKDLRAVLKRTMRAPKRRK